LVTVTKRIPAVGETVTGTDFQIHPGGKGANQAVAVARLGYPVQLIGRLGNDAFGAQLRTHLEKAGVDIAGVATSEGTSGVAVIVVSSKGENSIVVTPGANAKVTPQDLETNIEMIRQAGIVLAQLEIPLETIEHLSLICAREGVPLMLDPAPARELPSDVFKHIEWFTPNQTEAAFFAGGEREGADKLVPSEMAKLLLSKGNRSVVLKIGPEGAYLASQDGLPCESCRHDRRRGCVQRRICHRAHAGKVPAGKCPLCFCRRCPVGDAQRRAAFNAHHGRNRSTAGKRSGKSHNSMNRTF
jgi:ribokinase